jgi:ribose transport system substrate-binding protein
MTDRIDLARRRFAALVGGSALALATRPAWADYTGAPRTFLWNPGFNDMVDTARFKKSGPYTIGFANASQADLWLVTFTHGVEFAAAKNKDRIKKLIMTDANGDAAKQVSDIQDLMNQGIDLLLVNPAAADPLDPIMARAMKQGIPVVSVARRPKTDSSFVSFVTASDQALARISATWLAENLGGKGSIVLLPGLAGASPAEMRLQAAKEVFGQYPDLKILDTQYTGWSPANGKKLMSAVIQRHGKAITGVWADSGLQGSGAVEAFLAAGYKPEEIPPMTGGDLNRMYKLAVENKFPFCGIDYTPSIGIAAMDVVLDVLQGKSVPKRLDVNFQVVISEGDETRSVKADVPLKDYVRMDAADDLIMGHGMGPTYDPKTFKVDLPKG